MDKPIIGISANYKNGESCIADAYVEAVRLAGGEPVLIPVDDDEQKIAAAVRGIDGLLMSGGADIDPKYFGEEPIPELGEVVEVRDTYDWNLVEYARRYQTPILAICRGMQVLNVHFGGNLYQDIYAQSDKKLLQHDQGDMPRTESSHKVTIAGETRIVEILASHEIAVNSFHHQAVKDVAPMLNCSGVAPDGICEAIESVDYPVIGVQWHPENLSISGRKDQLNLFRWLVAEAQIHHDAVEIHNQVVVLDSHCDTPMVYVDGMNFAERNEGALVDFVKMDEGKVGAIFMAAYIPQKDLDETSTAEATRLAIDKLQLIRSQVDSSNNAVIASSAQDIREAKRAGKKAVVPVIENGYALGNDLSLVEKFYNMGVTYITLCHNGDNFICDSASRSDGRNGGVSEFGRQVIAEMNRLGIMVDMSHAGEKSFWDAIECSEAPIICSHSSSRALCNHPRNLTDEQLRALAKKGGVCQICLYDGFLTTDEGTACVYHAVDHIDHIVEVAGIDHVGIGSDFDGGGAIKGCQAENELINITKELLRRGYSHEDICKILGGNMLRVMEEVKNVSKNLNK